MNSRASSAREGLTLEVERVLQAVAGAQLYAGQGQASIGFVLGWDQVVFFANVLDVQLDAPVDGLRQLALVAYPEVDVGVRRAAERLVDVEAALGDELDRRVIRVVRIYVLERWVILVPEDAGR